METYAMIVQEYNNKVSESNLQFEKRLVSSESRRCQSRGVNLAKAVMTIMTESENIVNLVRSPRPQTWWRLFSRDDYPEEQCLRYLKCSRKTFLTLAATLGPRVTGKNVSAQCDKKQIAVMLHKFGKRADNEQLSKMFGIDTSTVDAIIRRTIRATDGRILQSTIKMPKHQEARGLSLRLEETTMIPQLLGILEATHIPICTTQAGNLKNSNNFDSIVMQSIVDVNYRFRDVSIKHPGSTKDRRIFEDSSIYKFYDRVIPPEKQIIDNHEISYKIGASSSYPLLGWLLPEYDPATTSRERIFNERMTMARRTSSIALARLRGRFDIIAASIDVDLEMVPMVIAACCVIHNICEENKDPCPEDWLIESRRENLKFPQPERARDTRKLEEEDVKERDAISAHLERKLRLPDDDSFH